MITLLSAIPDQKAATNLWPIGIPHLGSLIITHSWNGEIRGLNEVPARDRPYVPSVFFAFRMMVGAGLVLLILTTVGAYYRWRGHLFIRRWFLTALVAASPLGFVAIVAGWIVTEAGRQPYVVYGMLRTSDATSPLAAVSVSITLILFVIVYAFLLLGFIWFFSKAVILGPESTELPDYRARSALGRMRSTPELVNGGG